MKKFETRPETANTGANNDALESLLRNARADAFTTAETDRIWSRMGPLLGARADHAGLNSSTGSLPAKGLGILGAKTKGLLLLGGGVVVAGLAAMGMAAVALHRGPLAVDSRTRAAAMADEPRLRPAEGTPGDILGGVGALANSFSGLAQSGLPATPLASPTPNPTLPKRIESPERSSVDTNAGVARVEQAAGVLKRAADTNTESSESKDVPAPETRPPTPADQTINEGALLLRARRELASNPADTLKLTEEHSRFFPTGTLSPERDVLGIEALVQLGRLHEARARLAVFRARYPQSPHLARLEGLVGR